MGADFGGFVTVICADELLASEKYIQSSKPLPHQLEERCDMGEDESVLLTGIIKS